MFVCLVKGKLNVRHNFETCKTTGTNTTSVFHNPIRPARDMTILLIFSSFAVWPVCHAPSDQIVVNSRLRKGRNTFFAILWLGTHVLYRDVAE